jgi:hypothetical protein
MEIKISAMTYFKLIAGIALFFIFIWFLQKSAKRYGSVKALLSFDIMMGILAGLYLVVTSLLALMEK